MLIPSEQNNLAIKFPELIKEWDLKRNFNLFPNRVRPFSNKKVWWRCSKNSSHTWEAYIYNRTLYGKGCPYCSGRLPSLENNLSIKHPNLVSEWNYNKNEFLKPETVTSKSGHKIWWICDKGHEWLSFVYNRSGNNSGCPYCAGDLASKENNLLVYFPELAKEWHPTKNEDLLPEYVVSGSDKKIWWRCSKNSTHEWQTKISHRTIMGSGCPFCCWSHTKLEKFVEEKLGTTKFNKSVLEKSEVKYQPDYKLSDNLYLNVDGLYWHSELQKNKDYHYKMREAYKTENKRILQFYEDEVYNKWNIVESIINNAVGKTKIKLGARKCNIKTTSTIETNKFYNINHLMGRYSSAKHYGLYFNNELVSCISIINKTGYVEIARFCNKLNTSIAGSFQKLLSHVIKLYNPKQVTSFCDLRYATGESYKKAGFMKVNVSQGWQWTDGVRRYNRLACKAGDGKTEKDNAIEKGWYKIYDAGQAKYILDTD